MRPDFLKTRAEEFLTTADYHFQKEMYHLAAFDLEQACQLYLKYTLFLKLKQFPPTHSLRELLKGVGKAFGKEKAIKEIIQKNLHLIADLEQAYLTSRYLPAEFTKEQIRQMRDFVKELIGFLKRIWPKP